MSANELVARVRDVFAGGLDPRVRDYARHRLGASVALRVGCLVQRMLEPEASGVLFTAHPVTGSREVLALSAIAGLGEALVSGRRAGDYLELRRSDASLVSQRLEGDAPVVAPETAREIVRLGLRVEAELDAPQDIECRLHDPDKVMGYVVLQHVEHPGSVLLPQIPKHRERIFVLLDERSTSGGECHAKPASTSRP